MKRIIVCLLTGLLAVGMMAGCSKKLDPGRTGGFGSSSIGTAVAGRGDPDWS